MSVFDYCALLSRAVAGLERDSSAARGAIYDCEQKALLRRLFSAYPPHSDAEIEQERNAFREAVRCVELGITEFSDEGARVPLVPQAEPAPELTEAIAIPATRGDFSRPAHPIPQRQESSRDKPAWPRLLQELEQDGSDTPQNFGPSKQEDAIVPDPALRNRRPIAGRVLRRALLGVMLLGVGATAYGILTEKLTLPSSAPNNATVTAPVGKPSASPIEIAPTRTQQAILFGGNRPDANAPKFPGTATWRLRSEPTAPNGESNPVIQADLDIPGRKVIVTIRHEPPESAISHSIEFRFLREDNQPDPNITNIAKVVMTTAEMTRPVLLDGKVVRTTPGLFVFELSEEPSARQKNMSSLKELPWIALPIAYRNGLSGVLAMEKGVDGEHILDEALRSWGE